MDLKEFVSLHGQTGTGNILGVTQGAVWQWLNGRVRMTAERAKKIEELTGGAMKRHELRPDIFDPPCCGVHNKRCTSNPDNNKDAIAPS